MERSAIACASCGRHWPLPGTLTVYETRALESHPCPYCGAPRLSCDQREEKPACGLALAGSRER